MENLQPGGGQEVLLAGQMPGALHTVYALQQAYSP